MIYSRCHKADVEIIDHPEGSYYVCTACYKATETLCVMVLSDLEEMSQGDDNEHN